MTDEQITFPFLYFTVDNFDELFEGMVVTQGHDACVELVIFGASRSLKSTCTNGPANGFCGPCRWRSVAQFGRQYFQGL